MGAIKNIKESFDEIIKITNAKDNSPLYEKLIQVQRESMELVDEIKKLKDKNDELEDYIKKNQEMKFKEPFYFIEGDDVPYCPVCWQKHDRQMHLLIRKLESTMSYSCPDRECRFYWSNENPGDNRIIRG